MFQVPPICNYLTKTSKLKVLYTAERDEQGSKVTDFFSRTDDLFNEMIWQKKLRGLCFGDRFFVDYVVVTFLECSSLLMKYF